MRKACMKRVSLLDYSKAVVFDLAVIFPPELLVVDWTPLITTQKLELQVRVKSKKRFHT